MLTDIDGLCRIYRKEKKEICSQLVQQKVIHYAFIILYWNQGPSFITIPKVILHIEIVAWFANQPILSLKSWGACLHSIQDRRFFEKYAISVSIFNSINSWVNELINEWRHETLSSPYTLALSKLRWCVNTLKILSFTFFFHCLHIRHTL